MWMGRRGLGVVRIDLIGCALVSCGTSALEVGKIGSATWALMRWCRSDPGVVRSESMSCALRGCFPVRICVS